MYTENEKRNSGFSEKRNLSLAQKLIITQLTTDTIFIEQTIREFQFSKTPSNCHQCPDTQLWGEWRQILQNGCAMLTLLVVLYNDNHKADFINHKIDHNRKKNSDFSYNIPIFPSPKKAF